MSKAPLEKPARVEGREAALTAAALGREQEQELRFGMAKGAQVIGNQVLGVRWLAERDVRGWY